MIKWSKYFTPSKTSPRNGRRGDIIAQGIGSISATIQEDFLAQENGDLILQEDNYNIIT
jgi:hypothetical protein